MFFLFVNTSLPALEAYRGSILHFLTEPNESNISESYEYFDDGILLVDLGKIVSVGRAEDQLSKITKDTEVHIYDKNALIVPGFIDTHIHFPQVDMIASYGEQLLEWLNKYTFPHEKRFWDKEYSKKIANIFTQELLRNGSTTALVFASASRESVEALFEVAKLRNMRIISGNALGDRNLPDYLLKSREPTYHEIKNLIEKWHGNGRISYAITPRFAPTSSEDQLEMIQGLLKEYPDVYVHTHLSENLNEVKWVSELFPWSKTYLDVYKHFDLVRPRSMFAHSIHISDEEIADLASAKAAVSFCPTSNLFLGSGLFKWKQCKRSGLLIGIGTDVGAGTSFSMLKTLGEGYKIAQLQGDKMTPLEAFYHATLGGAKALYIDQYVGNFEAGKEADFVVMDLGATSLMSFRLEEAVELKDKLFLLMILGDDRNIKETYIMGKREY
jgi:guanine deaminase